MPEAGSGKLEAREADEDIVHTVSNNRETYDVGSNRVASRVIENEKSAYNGEVPLKETQESWDNTVGSCANSYMELTERQRAIIVGSLLGDGTIESRWATPRLRFGHGIRQKEYLFWKYEELKNLVNRPPRLMHVWHRGMGKTYESWHFSTRSFPALKEFYGHFYESGRKRVPELIQNLLIHPLSLAVWLMDDGYKRSDCNAIRLNTDAFSDSDQYRLVDTVAKNFGVQARIHKKGRYRNLYIPVRSTKHFIDLAGPYVISNMQYKIALAP